jgi:type IV secretion system protein VirD4
MYVPPQRQESLLLMVVFAGLFGWGAWKSLKLQALPFIPYVLGFLALVAGFKALSIALVRLRNILMRRDAMEATTQRGSASWATSKDLKRAGLYNTSGVFLGCDTEGRPLFFDGEIHGLTLAPAGSGKTIAFSIPAFCHSSLPMIVSDFKGTLAVMTKPLREKQHRQEVFCVNPAHFTRIILVHRPVTTLFKSCSMIGWTRKEQRPDRRCAIHCIAALPRTGYTGENTFFRNGSGKYWFWFHILIAFHGAGKATLSEALSLLRNVKELIEVCEVAMSSPILNGELADMATELHYKLTAQDTRQVDSFLEGAVQALAAFSASGWLAESTSTCDFRFKDLKEIQATVYLIADPTKMKVFAPWMGLMGWAAITELTRCQNTKPVFFLLDEATNFRIENLSNSLTG